MTSEDLKIALKFLSRIPARGADEERDLFRVITKMQEQIARNNRSKNEYNKDGTKAA
jgi:hypothetical protein